MIISNSLKYIYFAVPKTASASISNILVKKYEGSMVGNWHSVVVPINCCNYYKFCTVRHPYTRAISFFLYCMNTKKHRCNKLIHSWYNDSGKVYKNSFLKYMQWMTDLSIMPQLKLNQWDDKKEFYTERFLDYEFYDQSINLRFGRELNQTDYLCYAFGINYMDKMDYIIRIEDLENEFNKLPFVKKHTSVPHDNKSKQGNLWKTIIQKESEELIYQWAKDDFVAFNYNRSKF